MNRDIHYEKRMIVNKYSNIPPFNLKQSDQSSNVSGNIFDNPEANCNNCCKKRQKHLQCKISKPVSNFEKIDTETDTSENKVISKVMRNFQKATPSREFTTIDITENDSIETLYRKSSNIKLGKNIPGHRLMKNLLQNFDNDGDKVATVQQNKKKGNSPKKSHNKTKIKNRKQNLEQNKITPNEIQTNTSSHSVHYSIDKDTSTTGLVWPPRSVEVINYCGKNCYRIPVCPKEEDIDKINSESYKTRQNNSNGNRNCTNNKCENVHRIEQPKKDIPIKSDKPNSSRQKETRKKQPKTLKVKQNSFVQMQVEKLNNVLGIGDGNKVNNMKKQDDLQINRTSQHSDYMDMINAARNKVPWIKEGHHYSNDQEWSDGSDDCVSTACINFPKETKMAIYQQLNDQRHPKSLSQFATVENFRPAVPLRNSVQHYDDYPCHTCLIRPHVSESNATRKYMGNTKLKIPMPCKKNLLCDKGDHHHGPCGYTHNTLNKIVH
ncbi:uncharacterized protein LOC143194439 [Rhynchophorus ferrugineus]|uniref:uncharacterized protein LOC143194439 n=1 Tax=Rhynchophorus ferrugineus TaxID=354439 RepID=UPI003FCC82C7